MHRGVSSLGATCSALGRLLSWVIANRPQIQVVTGSAVTDWFAAVTPSAQTIAARVWLRDHWGGQHWSHLNRGWQTYCSIPRSRAIPACIYNLCAQAGLMYLVFSTMRSVVSVQWVRSLLPNALCLRVSPDLPAPRGPEFPSGSHRSPARYRSYRLHEHIPCPHAPTKN